MKISIVFLVLLISIYVSASPSVTFKDAAKWKNYINSLEISQGLVSGSLKDTHQAVASLENLGGSFTSQQTQDICSNVRQTLEKRTDVETIYHASSIAKILKCSLSQVRVESTLKQILDSESSVEEFFYAVSSGNNLKALGLYEFDESAIESISVIDSLAENDGTIANRKTASGTVYHSGLAFETLAILASNLELSDDATISAFVENSEDLLKEQLKKTAHGSVYYDRGDSRGAFRVSYAILKGTSALAPSQIPLSIVEQVAEYILYHAPEAKLEDVYYFSSLLRLLTEGPLPHPLVLSLSQSSFEATKGGDASIKVKVTDVLGNPVPELVVFLLKANSGSKTIANNIKLFLVANSKDEYEFSLPTLKNEQGLYSLEFGAQTTDKKVAITQAVRSVKVLSAIVLGNVDLNIIDSGNKESSQVVTATESRPFGLVKTSYFYTLSFTFQVKNQNTNKQIAVQQAFIKLTGAKSSLTVPAKYGDSNYRADINLKNYGKDLLYHTGEYTVELIVGDSFVSNPKILNLGSIRIEFPKNYEEKVKEKDSVYTAKKEIEHKFRQPEKRPDESVSFAFTIAVLAPFLILLFTLITIGVNIRIPSGLSFIYNLIFAATIISIFTLYGWFWYELNMFQTLGYLGVIGVVAILSGNLALRARNAHRNAPKEKPE